MTPTPTAPEIGAGLMDLEPAMVTQADREEAARFFHYADWRDSQENGGTAGPGITARLAETLARHRLATAPIPLSCDPVVREKLLLRFERRMKVACDGTRAGKDHVKVRTTDWHLLMTMADDARALATNAPEKVKG
jgi:hypothetical protein